MGTPSISYISYSFRMGLEPENSYFSSGGTPGFLGKHNWIVRSSPQKNHEKPAYIPTRLVHLVTPGGFLKHFFSGWNNSSYPFILGRLEVYKFYKLKLPIYFLGHL